MILSYNPNNEEPCTPKPRECELSNVSSIHKDNSRNSSFSGKDLSNDHIFDFDVKYSEIFARKNKIQNDDMFYENFEDLRIIGNMKTNGLMKSEISYSHDDSQLSFKEENFFNQEFIKMINTTTIKERHSRSNSLNVSRSNEDGRRKSGEVDSGRNLLKSLKKDSVKTENIHDGMTQSNDLTKLKTACDENKNYQSNNNSVKSDFSQGSRRNYIPKNSLVGENNLEKVNLKEKNANTIMKKNSEDGLNQYAYYDRNFDSVSHFGYRDDRLAEGRTAPELNLNFSNSQLQQIPLTRYMKDTTNKFTQEYKFPDPIQNHPSSHLLMNERNDLEGQRFPPRKFSSNQSLNEYGIGNGNAIEMNAYNQLIIKENKNLKEVSIKNSSRKHSKNENSESLSNSNNKLNMNTNFQNFHQPGKFTNHLNVNRNEVQHEHPMDINPYNQQVYDDNSNLYDVTSNTSRRGIKGSFNSSNANNKLYINTNLQSNNSEDNRRLNFNNYNNNFSNYGEKIQAYPNYHQQINTDNSNNYLNYNNYGNPDFRKANGHLPKPEMSVSNSNNNINYNPHILNNSNTSGPNKEFNHNRYNNNNNNNQYQNQQQHKINQGQKNNGRTKGSSNNFANAQINNNYQNNAYVNNFNNDYGHETPIHFNQNQENFNNTQNKNQYIGGSNNQFTKNHKNINPNLKNYQNNLEFSIASKSSKQMSTHPSIVKNKKIERFQKLNMKFEDMTDEELAQLSLHIAKDQIGCRFLQKKVEQSPKYTNEILFPEIYNDLIEFMTDSFGNYLIQKMIENMDERNFEIILDFINQNFLDLGLNPHGTRVIQKVIECLKLERHFDFFNKVFEQSVSDLIKDVNGNHIIIKYVSTVKFPYNEVLFNSVGENIIEFATNKHACCAFQKCLNFGNNDQVMNLIDKIVDNTFILMSDAYGNYLLQYVLMVNDYETNYKITSHFKNKIGYLSKQKFSSNVIEKCFDHCDAQTIAILVKEICNPKLIVDLLLDMYGNYVLQKALSSSEEPQRSIFIKIIGLNLEKLKLPNFGPKLLNKLFITYPEFSQNMKSNMCMSTTNRKNSNESSVGIGNSISNPNTNNVNSRNYYQPESYQQLSQNYNGDFRNVNYNNINSQSNTNNGYIRNKNNHYIDPNTYPNFIRDQI